MADTDCFEMGVEESSFLVILLLRESFGRRFGAGQEPLSAKSLIGKVGWQDVSSPEKELCEEFRLPLVQLKLQSSDDAAVHLTDSTFTEVERMTDFLHGVPPECDGAALPFDLHKSIA